ncbi:hypothetical protein DPEC_G00206620 [Dallia pectoralis]|uniref:Uncharacterized protein n=1 Tax=Dallia pectoralis TaxID=75939 RepID=A0ACC2G4D9_DALPE|nr:hypothetical protein DPEC_G00206620 [Dallia pectoralis]
MSSCCVWQQKPQCGLDPWMTRGADRLKTFSQDKIKDKYPPLRFSIHAPRPPTAQHWLLPLFPWNRWRFARWRMTGISRQPIGWSGIS